MEVSFRPERAVTAGFMKELDEMTRKLHLRGFETSAKECPDWFEIIINSIDSDELVISKLTPCLPANHEIVVFANHLGGSTVCVRLYKENGFEGHASWKALGRGILWLSFGVASLATCTHLIFSSSCDSVLQQLISVSLFSII